MFLQPENHSFRPLARQKRRALPCKKNLRGALLQSSPRTTSFRRTHASPRPNGGAFRGELCGPFRPKPAQKGGPPLAGGHREGPPGREMAPKVPRGRPQKRLPDQCGGWKSDEVLHFSAPDIESLLEWGGCARAPPRTTFFLRERGGPPGELVLCLSVSSKS